MPRNSFNLQFQRMAQEVLPPGLDLLCINSLWLHPVITEGGGFDNAHTMFGLTVPAAHGKSLYCQVSTKTEKLLAEDKPKAIESLREDIRAAMSLWNGCAVDHTHALAKMVVL